MPCGNLSELLRDARVASLPHLGPKMRVLLVQVPEARAQVATFTSKPEDAVFARSQRS